MGLKTNKQINKVRFNKLATHPLQSWEWGEFRKKAGNEVVRFEFGQITLHPLPLTNYQIGAFIKGPKPTAKMLTELKKLAKEKNLIYIKLEPNVIVNSNLKSQDSKLQVKNKASIIKMLKKSGAVPGRTLFTPTSFWLDLTKSENELFQSFHPKTRYNIRLAQRKGVEVLEDNSQTAFERYLELTKETVKRQGFYAHTEKYHRLMWETLHLEMIKAGKEPIARLLTARYKGQIITTWILFVWHDFLYYPYGASSSQYKNVMANNLVMWEAIRYGQRLKLKTFDLWGREPGKGFTRFKEGYRPQVVEFLGTWDLVNSPLYYPYRLAETFRWLILRSKVRLGLSRPKF